MYGPDGVSTLTSLYKLFMGVSSSTRDETSYVYQCFYKYDPITSFTTNHSLSMFIHK